MKICIMSDTHLSAQLYQKVDHKVGLNRFLVRQFESLEWVTNYLKKNGIDTIVHAGDVFDSSKVTVYPIKRTKDLFSDFTVHAIKGNHDDNNFLHENEISALNLLDINAYNSPEAVVIGGANFVFIPWGYEIDDTLIDSSKKNVLVAHGFPRDYIGTGLANDKDTNVGGVLSNKALKFDLVITGHYHIIDQFKIGKTQFLNPGSLSSYSTATGFNPSIWILDTSNLYYTQVEIPCAVKVIESTPDDLNSFLDSIKEENIYRLTVSSKTSIDRKRLFSANKKALDIQFKLIPKKEPVIEIDKIDNFWQYVAENSKYCDEFHKTLEEIGME